MTGIKEPDQLKFRSNADITQVSQVIDNEFSFIDAKQLEWVEAETGLKSFVLTQETFIVARNQIDPANFVSKGNIGDSIFWNTTSNTYTILVAKLARFYEKIL